MFVESNRLRRCARSTLRRWRTNFHAHIEDVRRIELGEPLRVPVARPTVAAAKALTAQLEQAVSAWPA